MLAQPRIRTLVLLTCLGLGAPGLAQAEKLVIGVPAWPSAEVTAQIIASTMQEELGIETELRERGTLTILSDIGRGEVDVHPEMWFPNLAEAVERLQANDVDLRVSSHGVAAAQNICVTRHTADTVGISAVGDLLNPEIARNFDSNGDGLGEIWIGAETWSSTEIEKVRAHSYGYDRTMTLLEMPEDVAMAAVDAAASLQKPIVFYCYQPHHVFELHDIVTLSEPPYDAAKWNLVKRADDPDWLAKSQAETAWDDSHFHIGYAGSLVTEMPEVANFLGNITLEPADAVMMSYAVEVEGKSPEEAASEWMAANEDRIRGWLK